MKRVNFLFLLAAILLLINSCKQTPHAHQKIVELTLGDQVFYAQIVSKPQEMQQGLMFRKALEKNHGMLFAFPKPAQQSFWMKNTEIPLSIGYFDSDGILKEIYPLYPHDTNPVSSVRTDILYALEMEQGWFKENNISIGSQLDLEAVRNALEK